MKRTKIIATIGPASGSLENLAAMVKAGMNVARLNFSHGSYDSHLEFMANIRKASAKAGRPIAILQDLQGPKIRVGSLKAPFPAKANQSVVIGRDFRIAFDLSKTVKPGHRILIEDGRIVLKVVKVQGKNIHCKVVTGGLVQSHKGVNLPDSQVNFPIFTRKDARDLKFGLENKVDFVALSFVRGAGDIIRLKKLIVEQSRKKATLPKIIAKIERLEAVERIDEILREADGIMIGRGDLGVEIPDSQVPVIQKTIIGKAIQAAKPVIVATQMLESMVENPRPTRAEVSDVANAVIDKADAVMLSEESATGKYPVLAVKEMSQIIEDTETSQYVHYRLHYDPALATDPVEHQGAAVADSAYDLAHFMSAAAIIGTTETGFTPRFIAQQRPEMPIIILADNPVVYRQMSLNWGVTPLLVNSLNKLKHIQDLLEYLLSQAKRMKIVRSGDSTVLVAGNPLGQRMNLIEIVKVK